MNIVRPEAEDYMRTLVGRYDEPLLCAMEDFAAERGFPIVGRLCGVTIELLSRAVGARRVFELGSGFGYSAYWFLRGLAPDGEIHLTDGDPANEERWRGWNPDPRIRFHVGDALTSFAAVDGDFDVVYCDVDKAGYPDCWRAARERIRPGGLYVCDNTLWSGRVAEPDPDAATRAIIEHNRLVADDPGFVSVIVPTRDGLLVALRTA